jgi:hypothetical protein
VLALSDKLGVEASDALVEEVNALFARPVARIAL